MGTNQPDLLFETSCSFNSGLFHRSQPGWGGVLPSGREDGGILADGEPALHFTLNQHISSGVPKRDYGNLAAAVGAPCGLIRKIVRELGVSETKVTKQPGNIRSRQQQHEFQLTSQQVEIRALKIALQSIVTLFEYDN